MKTWAILGTILCIGLILSGCTKTDEEITGPGPSYSGTKIDGEEVSGTLSAANSPYWIDHDLLVPESESLVIEAGVELRFDGLHKMVVQGRLEAIGTADANIKFTSMEGAFGNGGFSQWRSLIFDTGNNEASEMAFCLVQFGAVPDTAERYPVYPEGSAEVGRWLNGVVFIWNCSPLIRNCTILKNGYHGVWVLGENSNPYFINTNFYENDGDGIRIEPEADVQLWYNNSKENNTLQYGGDGIPDGIGESVSLNANRDSCDFQYNIRLEPYFTDFENQNYDLLSTSHLINAGKDTLGSGTNIGSIPYDLGATELRGPIGGRVLTAAMSPWYVTNNVFIEPGETLEAEPGVEVFFDGRYNMRLAGYFTLDGTTFYPPDPENEHSYWDGIYITEDADDESYITDCQFINSSTTLRTGEYGGAITVFGAAPLISGNTFINSEYAAISAQIGAEPEIVDNVIDGFGPMAILCHNNSSSHIHRNVIKNGFGYGIWCNQTSSPWIESNLIYNTPVVGIKCQSDSDPVIEYNTIVSHDYAGIEIHDQSDPLITANIIAFNGSETKVDSGSTTGAVVSPEMSSISGAMTLEFDIYRRVPATMQQISRIGIVDGANSLSDGVYLEVYDSELVSFKAQGSSTVSEPVASFDARWQHVIMERDAAGVWTITWDAGGANEMTLNGSDGFGSFTNPRVCLEGEPYSNSAHFDNIVLRSGVETLLEDDFQDENYSADPTWSFSAGLVEIAQISTTFCLHVAGDLIYGNGINVAGASTPTIAYNDVFQDELGFPYGGVSPARNNIELNPQFVDIANGDFHLQSGSPCLTAGPDGGEIGAYGRESNW
ncbi:right-handed parallel beta-helix repeat-containing protein [bacterium]|nr:right-handed parallel beta-helix repeat-containing protein [bacterium]